MIITYTAYTDPAVRHNAAIQDIKAYIGPRQYNEINNRLRAMPNLTYGNLRSNADRFLGIRGEIVAHWWRALTN